MIEIGSEKQDLDAGRRDGRKVHLEANESIDRESVGIVAITCIFISTCYLWYVCCEAIKPGAVSHLLFMAQVAYLNFPFS